MSIAKVIEISSESNRSFEDAINRGLERANSTLEGVSGAWIKEQSVRVNDGAIIAYRVNMMITFVLDGGSPARRANTGRGAAQGRKRGGASASTGGRGAWSGSDEDTNWPEDDEASDDLLDDDGDETEEGTASSRRSSRGGSSRSTSTSTSGRSKGRSQSTGSSPSGKSATSSSKSASGSTRGRTSSTRKR